MCKALNARPAIVTRKPILPGWREECKAMGVEPLFCTNYEAVRSKNFPYGRVVESARGKQSFEWKVSGRVVFGFDEVQACRSRKTLNTQMLVAASQRFKCHLISATSFTDPTEAFGVATTLRLTTQNKFWNWMLAHGVRKNFHGHMEFIGNRDGAKWQAEGLAIMDKIHRDIFPSRGVRTTRAQIPGFPEEVTSVVAVEVEEPGAIEKAYHELIELSKIADLVRAREGTVEDLQDLVDVLPVTKALRSRQTAEVAKCAAMAEMARCAANAGESVILFLNFDYSVNILCKMLETDCVVRGDRAGEGNIRRAHHITEFQANRQPYIIVNNAAGGAGISLHDPITQKPRTSLISPPWSALVLKQVLGRSHRLGGGFSTRKLIFASGTIEERVMGRVRQKMDQLDTLNDGDLDILDASDVTR